MDKRKKASKKKTTATTTKVGRPLKVDLDESHLGLIESTVKKGATDSDLAKSLGISRETFYRYIRENKLFRDTIKNAREDAHDLVERALFKRALGYDKKITKDVSTKNGIETLEETRHYPSSDASLIFYLKNRRPDKWKDRIEHAHTGTENPIKLAYDPSKPLRSKPHGNRNAKIIEGKKGGESRTQEQDEIKE